MFVVKFYTVLNTSIRKGLLHDTVYVIGSLGQDKTVHVMQSNYYSSHTKEKCFFIDVILYFPIYLRLHEG